MLLLAAQYLYLRTRPGLIGEIASSALALGFWIMLLGMAAVVAGAVFQLRTAF